MKAIVDSQLLAKELKKISPIIKKTSVLPILTCVKLSFAKSGLTIMATDLETTVLCTMDCECQKSFVVVIEFSNLVEVCSKMFEPITVELEGNNIHITSNNSKFNFVKSNDESEFPKVHDEEFGLTIDADYDLFYSLGIANNCKSNDQFKSNMNAACIHIKKDSLTVVGTDAYVAYKKELKIKTGKELMIMIPEIFIQMVKGFNDGKISIGEKFIKVEHEKMIIISRLMESKFVSYEMIIPKEIEFNFKADRNDLINSFSIAGVASAKSTNMCAINFNGGDIKISSQDIDYGKDGETGVKATHTVEIPAIGVNGSQMLKLLNFFDSEEVEMAFKGENNTIFLRPLGEPNTLCLLQPLSLI